MELQEDLTLISEYIKNLDLGGNSILITGSTGLIGSLLVKSFIEYNKKFSPKIEIYALARSREKVEKIFNHYFQTINDAKEAHINFFFQDIKSEIKLNVNVDYIIHTANPTNSKYMITYPVEVIDDIYIGSKMVLEYAKKCCVKGIVYLSSMEVFGVVNNDQRVSEKEIGYIDIQNIRSCYSETKRLVECMCKSYNEEYNLPVKVARLAQVFGAGVMGDENRVFAQFLRSAINNQDIVLHTEGKSIGNYCYTRDAIEAILLLLKNGKNGEVYNVVNEESSMSIYEMAELVIKTINNGNSKIVFDIPDKNIYGYPADTKMYLDGEKIMKLGWKPKINMKEAYLRMISSLK